MKRHLLIGFSSLLVLVAASALAAEGPLEKTMQQAAGTVIQGCDKELSTFCKNVTPGEGRLLACLYAYEDQLSPRCEYALYDSSAQLDRAINALNYTAQECGDDLQKYCADVQAGEGRLRDCLKKNEKKLSDRCKTAMKDVGVK
jgi:hypothetical protein